MSHDLSKLACWDMEMCCWEGRPIGEIISIGIAELHLPTGRITREANYIVRPDRDKVSEFCTELTGITQRMVDRQGRSLADVLKTIEMKFGGAGKVYVAWGDDAGYLQRQCDWRGIKSPVKQSLDASLLYRIRQRMTDGKSVGLLSALTKAGLAFEGRQHNSLNDAKNLARLITKENLL
ncbi:inhibitor of KinA sporulation pathway (predicted exonuclease) [Pseudomonas nitritireducens]|uniref:Inhibitor of KinA sporulation pathway (Predicted exonuclease) n=1 Tax=Pseudomonas nitroreducens TaxID=46680 RepID=A0A7W7KFC3_PSENT|nr:3'-5' exonuclease [Pseudomonas nitritireducens]MBB4861249.1 inhibitor of KinA sporulation pathway (predicted exonuclease) [Pseudomonas nitritireducens]